MVAGGVPNGGRNVRQSEHGPEKYQVPKYKYPTVDELRAVIDWVRIQPAVKDTFHALLDGKHQPAGQRVKGQ
jgi:hypothetical protein